MASKKTSQKKPGLLERLQARAKKTTDRGRAGATSARQRQIDAAVDGPPRKKKP